MEYERIHRPLFPQGGGFSPKKKLLRVERRRNEEEERESKSLRSEPTQFESGRASDAGSCKDVECSISIQFTGIHGRRDLAIGAWRIDSLESERTPLPPHRLTTSRATLAQPFSKPAPSKWDDAQKWIARPTPNRGETRSGGGGGGGGQAKKGGVAGYITREAAAKVVLDAVDEAETKRVDVSVSHAKKEVVPIENPVINADASARSTTIFSTPATAVGAVSTRDMGTETTPAASQATSPSSTSPPFPHRSTAQRRTTSCSTQTHSSGGDEEQSIQEEMSEKEQRRKTRREIMALGRQLGKTNIAAWASQEEEEMDATVSAMSVSKDHPAESVAEARAVAWEEAENAKYLARFRREEIKIAAWENHQNATIEAEMRKVEVEVERTWASAHERLINQLAAVRREAEAQRAAAEAKRDRWAGKTARRTDYIRRTGRIPFRFPCRGWYSLCRFLSSKDSNRSWSDEKMLK